MKADRAQREYSDEDLMTAIAGGDHAAFQELAARYMNLFYSIAFRMFPQRADAEEIVQESLLRLWSKAHLWKKDSGAAVSTWLYRIAYNLCIDQKRRDSAQTVPLEDGQIAGGIPADKRVNDKDIGRLVGTALQSLPERQRAALVLCHYQGLSNSEAADVMGTTVKGVEGLLVRARQALQKELKQYKGVL